MSDTKATPPAVDLFQTTFDVKVGKITYTFKIPGITYDMQVGAQAAAIRRLADPSGMGGMVDGATVQFSRYCAIMELYLESATDAWVFGGQTANPGMKPKVDHLKWTRNRINTVYRVGAAFEAEFARFRGDGDDDDDPAGAEVVDGVKNPGA